MFSAEYFIWSLRDIYAMGSGVLGFHVYHDNTIAENSPYNQSRMEYEQRRGLACLLKAKKPNKLYESIKEYENLLDHNDIVTLQWKSERDIDILVSNGCLIRISLSLDMLNIDRVLIDSSLVGKLISLPIQSGCFGDNLILCSNDSSSNIVMVTYAWNRRNSAGSLQKVEKLSAMNLKVSQFPLPQSESGGKSMKRFCLNQRKDYIIIWWTAVTFNSAKAEHIHLYAIKSGKLDLVQSLSTEAPVQGVAFRKSSSLEFLVIESTNNSAPGATSIVLEISTFAIKREEIYKIGQHSISVNRTMESFDLHPTFNVLLLVLEDGSLVLCDLACDQVTNFVTKMKFNGAVWHMEGTVFFAWNKEGEIRFYDLAGQSLPFTLQETFLDKAKCEYNISKYFRCNKLISQASWNPFISSGSVFSQIVISHEHGPLSLLRLDTSITVGSLSPSIVVQQYTSQGLYLEAVTLLRAISWTLEPQTCYTCLSIVINALIVLPIDKDRLGFLEDCLAFFYMNPKQIPEAIVEEYKERLICFTRRIFFHFLQNGFLEKAFLLAEDIGHSDLFLDLHYEANALGDLVLGEVARLKADLIDKNIDERDPASDSSSDVEHYFANISEECLNPPDDRGDNFAVEDKLLEQFSKILSEPTASIVTCTSKN